MLQLSIHRLRYKQMANGMGQPRRFSTGEELTEAVTKYVLMCMETKQMPNVAGFCIFSDLSWETWSKNKVYYPEHFKKAEMILEDGVIQSEKNSEAFRIFYMKNKFGYSDRIVNEISTPEPIKLQNMDKLSDDDLIQLKQLTKKMESDE